eukprot:Tbor_TRINITY_DN6184_c1_g1::TRINITY_DN6184_c1_g1_i24::g.22187::m.22187
MVMCRGLGFNIPLVLNPPRKPQWWAGGGGAGKIALSRVRCRYSDVNLTTCANYVLNPTDCNNRDDIWVECSPWEYRLDPIGGTRGRLQVVAADKDLSVKSWGTVCKYDFSKESAMVMCRGLGFNIPLVSNPPIKPQWWAGGGG